MLLWFAVMLFYDIMLNILSVRTRVCRLQLEISKTYLSVGPIVITQSAIPVGILDIARILRIDTIVL